MADMAHELLDHWCDSHIHWTWPDFVSENDGLRQDLRNKAELAGIKSWLEIGYHSQQWQNQLDYFADDLQVYHALGWHPLYLPKSLQVTDLELDCLADLLTLPSVKAVGEIGLDFYAKLDTKEVTFQQQAFEAQLDLAKSFDLPLVLHLRRSHEQALKSLKAYFPKGWKGVAHAFSGSYEQAKQFVDLGFKVGIGGAAVRPSSKKGRRLIEQLALTDLILETDAPFMPIDRQSSHVAFPSDLVEVGLKVADYKGLESQQVKHVTSHNFYYLFGGDS